MGYEVEFISVNKEQAKQDADAILIHWLDSFGSERIVVFDGGLNAHGEKMAKHIKTYYFSSSKKVIDSVICSHPDQDHVSGLKYILEHFEVNSLYMNMPWLYIDDIWSNVTDGRITKKSLEYDLRKNYSFINELEDIAKRKGIPIYPCFQGAIIQNDLCVLSPSKEFYLKLLVESNKTPLQTNAKVKESVFEAIRYVKSLIESWVKEGLREDVNTSEENEMSVVLLGEMEKQKFLLTGDAGTRALNNAISFSNAIGKNIIDTVNFIQVPHHGGRHNVSPSVLNKLVGEIVNEGEETGKVAFVSVADGSDHPLQMVVNAFIRRGVKIYKTQEGNIIRHSNNMPKRNGWNSITKLEFKDEVEEWKD